VLRIHRCERVGEKIDGVPGKRKNWMITVSDQERIPLRRREKRDPEKR